MKTTHKILSIAATTLLLGTTMTFGANYINDDANAQMVEMLQNSQSESVKLDDNTFDFDFTNIPDESTSSDLAEMLDAAQSPSDDLDDSTVEAFAPFFQEFEVVGGKIENKSCKILKPTVRYRKEGYTEDDVIGGIFSPEGEVPYVFLSDTSYTEQINKLPIVCVKNGNKKKREKLLRRKQRPLFFIK